MEAARDVGAFMPWAWLVATKLSKDARFTNQNWKLWNSIHLGAGSVALIVMVFTGASGSAGRWLW